MQIVGLFNLSLGLSILSVLLASCGGGDTKSSGGSAGVSVDDQEYSPAYCLPDLSVYNPSLEKPGIDLLGQKIEVLNIGDLYVENGAVASDEQDGDISTLIEIYGADLVDTNTVGDYMVRYEVTDSEKNSALPIYRFVRVQDGSVMNESKRFFSEVDAVWEYIEHLPKLFGADNDVRYPLLIVNHGWSHSKRFDTGGAMGSMSNQSMVSYLRTNNSVENLPYIILTPQRCWSDFAGVQISILHSFVEWAKRNYPVDINRVYMTGLSMGGWATWEYVRVHPTNLAAVAPMAAGGDISGICATTPTPIWAFTAYDDATVPYSHVTTTVERLNLCDGPFRAQPKLTVFPSGGHVIDDNVFNLTFLGQGDFEYDIFDRSLFDWFLEHELPQSD